MNIVTLICNIPLIILAIIGVSALIIFHEFGHYLFAKLFNVHTPSFSIGFGPRIIEKKIGDTVFALSALPLGGYVEMAGSQEIGQGEQAHAKDTGERSFNRKPYWQKMLIISGGILFNIIFAYLTLSFLFYVGTPCVGPWCNNNKPIINSMKDNSLGQKAGLKAKDTLISINNQSVATIGNVTDILKTLSGKQAAITFQRDNTEQTVNVDFSTIQPQTPPRLGIFWDVPSMPLNEAFATGWQAVWNMATEIFKALKGVTRSSDGLGGPLALIAIATECAAMGAKVFLFMLAFISVNLAVFNMLPLPIFDGGQALFFTIEALAGKPLSDNTRHKIHYVTWLLVLGLIVYLTYRDIIKLIGF